jgi:chromosome segregation ATPase
MARQKSAPKAAAGKKSPRPPSSTAYGRTAILLEEVRAEFKVIGEGLAQTSDEARRSLQALDERIGERLASIEFAVRDVVTRVVAHDAMLKTMDSKLDEHTRILGEHTTKLDEHTHRHDDALERLGDQARTLAHHSARLERIEAKLDRKAEAEDLDRLAERVSRLERVATGS